ncbi:nuclear speckle splicing regulatory protein 1 isoform X2 [Lampetra fluviatilis]
MLASRPQRAVNVDSQGHHCHQQGDEDPQGDAWGGRGAVSMVQCRYGLILSNKKKAAAAALPPRGTLPRPSVFDDDSDETTLQMQRVLEQDASVYEYDEVYDDMKRTRDEETRGRGGALAGGAGAPRESRYVPLLQAACKRRKREEERRADRLAQREREAEGERFADKAAYVTGAYRQRLLLLQQEEEGERRRDRLEAAMDVCKQQDLSGFYRHLLKQSVGGGGGAGLQRATLRSATTTTARHADDAVAGQAGARPGDLRQPLGGDGVVVVIIVIIIVRL